MLVKFKRLLVIAGLSLMLVGTSICVQASELPDEGTLLEEGVAESETAVSETETAETEAIETETSEAVVPEVMMLEEETEETAAKTVAASPVQAFVTRLYNLCLGREPDASGLQAWCDVLTQKKNTGAEAAYGFVFSKEYKSMNTDNEAYVTMLYKVMLGREPDASGLAGWIKRLENGMTREGIFAGFVNSAEFQIICDSYQINRGSYTSGDIRDKNPDVTAFVVRLYRLVLSREPDAAGLCDWIGVLLNGKSSGAVVAWDFLDSPEFKKKNVSDDEYINILYRTFLDREADEQGHADWLSHLSVGMSRRYAAGGFAGSQEYMKLCQSYGIQSGSLTLTESRDQNYELTKLIHRFYKTAFNGYNPTADQLNHWTGQILAGKTSASNFVVTFFVHENYLKRNRTDAEFITDLFQAGLGKAPSESVLNSWVKKLSSGSTREQICIAFAEGDDFRAVCQKFGIMSYSNGWNTIGTHKVYYKDGKRLSGWQKFSGKEYYFNPSNYNYMQTGWAYVDGYKYYFGSDGALVTNLDSMLGKQDSYHIKINKECNVVTVYAKDSATGEYLIPVFSSICSTGVATPIGTFSTPAKYRWHELDGPVWGQWCTRITGRVLFHSVYYNTYNDNMNLSVSAYNKLGTTASHGCCRLPAGTAKWIYDNCSLGTKVTVYESSTPGPYGKPSSYKLSSSHKWDPTDPTAYYKCQAKGCH